MAISGQVISVRSENGILVVRLPGFTAGWLLWRDSRRFRSALASLSVPPVPVQVRLWGIPVARFD